MATSFVPRLRGSVQTASSGSGANLSLTLPSDLYPGDLILIPIVLATAGTPGQSAGVTMAECPGTPGQGFTNAKSTIMYARARAPATAGAGVSQDAGTTVTLTNTSATPWAGVCACIANAHLTDLTAFGTLVKNKTATGVVTQTLSGCTPSAANGTLLTFFFFGSDANNVAQSFPATIAISGGGTDSLVTGATAVIQASGQKTRGIGIYAAASAPSTGGAVADRAITLVTGASVGALGGVSLCLVPMTGAAGDVLYKRAYKATPDDANAQVFDIFYPTTGSQPFPIALKWHGGIIGGDRYIDLTQDTIVTALLAAGYAVVPFEWRQAVAGSRGGDTAIYDAHTLIRYLIVNAATYGLDASTIVAHGSSAGAVEALITLATMNDATWQGPSPENSGTTETIDRALIWFPGSNLAFIDAWKTALSIANPSPTCSSGSDLGYALSTDGTWLSACSLGRWNYTAYNTGTASQDATATARLNLTDAAYWAQYGPLADSPLTRTPIYLMHGQSEIGRAHV